MTYLTRPLNDLFTKLFFQGELIILGTVFIPFKPRTRGKAIYFFIKMKHV